MDSLVPKASDDFGILPYCREQVQDENLGCWKETAAFVRRCGAHSVESTERGFNCSFALFALEAHLYDTRTVVGLNSASCFNLAELVSTPRVFSLSLRLRPPDAQSSGWDRPESSTATAATTYGPFPETGQGADSRRLAVNYALAMSLVLQKFTNLLDKSEHAHLQEMLMLEA